MSSISPDEQFGSDKEFKSVLESWSIPEPSITLDQRVSNSYQREFGGAEAEASSRPFPQMQKEVAAMKFCSTCQEEFAEKFSFCPVDGTPLNGFVPKVEDSVTRPSRRDELKPSGELKPSVEPSYASAEPAYASAGLSTGAAALSAGAAGVAAGAAGLSAGGAGLSAAADGLRPEYHFTFIDDSGLSNRLFAELKAVAHESELTWPEFKRNPFGFSKRMVTGYGQAGWKALSQPNVATGILSSLLLVMTIILGVIWFDKFQARRAVEEAALNEDQVVDQLIDIPSEQPTPDPGTAGLNKGSGGGSKPKPEKAAGGGGGGREDPKPASFGKTPQASLTVPQVVAPDPKPPVIKNPSLPVAATVVADPLLVPPDARVLPYGDFKSKILIPPPAQVSEMVSERARAAASVLVKGAVLARDVGAISAAAIETMAVVAPAVEVAVTAGSFPAKM